MNQAIIQLEDYRHVPIYLLGHYLLKLLKRVLLLSDGIVSGRRNFFLISKLVNQLLYTFQLKQIQKIADVPSLQHQIEEMSSTEQKMDEDGIDVN